MASHLRQNRGARQGIRKETHEWYTGGVQIVRPLSNKLDANWLVPLDICCTYQYSQDSLARTVFRVPQHLVWRVLRRNVGHPILEIIESDTSHIREGYRG